MNRHDPSLFNAGEAIIKFLDGDFQVVRPGTFVRCGVTGQPIAIEDLRYWSVDRQEAYATQDAVLKRAREARGASQA